MALAVWDVNLPQKQFSGITEAWQDGFIRSNMDAGRPKTRLAWTADVRELNIPIVLSTAEKAIFTAFYEITIARGSLEFTWTDPDDDTTTITFKFKSRPALTKVAGTWKGMMNFEILP